MDSAEHDIGHVCLCSAADAALAPLSRVCARSLAIACVGTRLGASWTSPPVWRRGVSFASRRGVSQGSFMTPPYRIITPEELRELILDQRAGKSEKKIQVVDVRDDDFIGGQLPGAINVPSEEWYDEERISALVHALKSKDLVVFHCRFSQQRGPFTATRFSAKASCLLEEKEGRPEVAVLQGGFETWRSLYSREEGMVCPCMGVPGVSEREDAGNMEEKAGEEREKEGTTTEG